MQRVPGAAGISRVARPRRQVLVPPQSRSARHGHHGLRRSGAKPAHSRPPAPPPAGRPSVARPGAAGVVQRVASERQAPALDRVGEEDGRGSLGVGLGESGLSSSPMSWPPRSPIRPGSSSSDVVAARARHRACIRPSARASRPICRIKAWYCWFDMSSMLRAARRHPGGRTQPAACGRTSLRARATGAEHRLQLGRPYAGDDTIKALAIQIDDPEHVAERSRRCSSATASQIVPSSNSASPRTDDEAPARARAEDGSPRMRARAPRTRSRLPRSPPTRARSRPGRDPSCGWDRPAGHGTRAACQIVAVRCPSRYWTAWNAGEACGLGATRSPARR